MTVVRINAITVPANSGAALAERFAARAGHVEGQDGFLGFELLRPTDDRSVWLVVTRWRDEAAFAAWTAGEDFQRAHGDRDADAAPPRHPVGLSAELWSYDVAETVAPAKERPALLHTAIDATDARALAEFYRELLGLRYRPGDEPPADGTDDAADWLVLVDAAGVRKLAFQQVDRLERTTWPRHDVPMQMHLDFTVPDLESLLTHRRRAEALGAELVLDRAADPDEALCVLADPAGHPFCLLVA